MIRPQVPSDPVFPCVQHACLAPCRVQVSGTCHAMVTGRIHTRNRAGLCVFGPLCWPHTHTHTQMAALQCTSLGVKVYLEFAAGSSSEHAENVSCVPLWLSHTGTTTEIPAAGVALSRHKKTGRGAFRLLGLVVAAASVQHLATSVETEQLSSPIRSLLDRCKTTGQAHQAWCVYSFLQADVRSQT